MGFQKVWPGLDNGVEDVEWEPGQEERHRNQHNHDVRALTLPVINSPIITNSLSNTVQ